MNIELALTLRHLWTTSGLKVRHTKTETKLNENSDHRPHRNLDSPESNTINGFLEKKSCHFMEMCGDKNLSQSRSWEKQENFSLRRFS